MIALLPQDFRSRVIGIILAGRTIPIEPGIHYEPMVGPGGMPTEVAVAAFSVDGRRAYLFPVENILGYELSLDKEVSVREEWEVGPSGG